MAILEHPEKLRMYNDVLIKANKTVEDTIQVGDKQLFKDFTFDKHRSKRINGTVVAVPFALRPTRIHQTDHEWPKGTQWFGGEIIQTQIHAYQSAMRRRLQERETKQFTDRYRSTNYEPEYTRNNDQEIIAQVGDTAWFHYLVLNDSNYMGQDLEHNRYYRVPYETIFCFARGSEVFMVNGYVQVKPYWNSDFEEIEVDGKIIRGKLKGNLVVALKEAPEYLTGTVVKKGPCFGADTRSTIKEGDVVIYAKGSEFKNTILGEEVMLMKQWKIIAKKIGNKFVPVGDYCAIRTRKLPPRKIVLMDSFKRNIGGAIEDVNSIKKDLANLVMPVGDLIDCGENCRYVSGSMKQVYFNTGAQFFNLEDLIFIHEGDIMAEIEGNYIVPNEYRISI